MPWTVLYRLSYFKVLFYNFTISYVGLVLTTLTSQVAIKVLRVASLWLPAKASHLKEAGRSSPSSFLMVFLISSGMG